MKKYCFDYRAPSNPKSDNALRYSSFSQRRMEKSDSIVLVLGNNVATTPQ